MLIYLKTPVIFHPERISNILSLILIKLPHLLKGLTETSCKIVCFLDLYNATLSSLARKEQK